MQRKNAAINSLIAMGGEKTRKFFDEQIQNPKVSYPLKSILIKLDIKGSYAGAMGYGQFISSSYRAYAIDYDGDGNADLFNSAEDAIGSVANYLYIHGWKREGAIVYESFPNNVRKVFKPSDGLSKFIPLSFNENGKDINFIGDDNFVAITKYNISHFYAMAVYYLSQELKT